MLCREPPLFGPDGAGGCSYGWRSPVKRTHHTFRLQKSELKLRSQRWVDLGGEVRHEAPKKNQTRIAWELRI